MLPSRKIMSGINPLLERINSYATISIQKRFLIRALVNIHINNLGDHIRHIISGKRRPQNFADGCIVLRSATKAYLVELLTFFINTQNADVSYVVMATGIHTTRYVQIDFAKIV